MQGAVAVAGIYGSAVSGTALRGLDLRVKVRVLEIRQTNF
jgi:hypothetical protein